MPAPRNRLSLEDARQIIILQKFKRSKDFYAWRDRPKNIPSNPRQTYGVAWLGWKYFLGTGAAKKAAKKKVPILPFEEAKALAQKMMQKYGITSQPQWYVWTKTVDKPPGMPIDPYTTYKGEGWISWPDWFGRKPSRASGLEAVLAFSDAREFARSLGLQTSREWYSWAATSARPADIPYSPDTRYREEGWIGWGDFIGFHNRWTHQGIVSFLDSLVPCIEHLTEIDLYLILSKNGMLQRDARLRGAKLLRGLKHARTPSQLETAKQQIADELEAEQEADNSGASGDDASNLIALAELEPIDDIGLTIARALRIQPCREQPTDQHVVITIGIQVSDPVHPGAQRIIHRDAVHREASRSIQTAEIHARGGRPVGLAEDDIAFTNNRIHDVIDARGTRSTDDHIIETIAVHITRTADRRTTAIFRINAIEGETIRPIQ